MKVLFFALVLFTSCTRHAELSKDTFGIKISSIQMDISQLNEITWWIGAKRKEEKVTQSVTFLVDMPKLKDDDLEYLSKDRDVDSWIVRVIQVKGSKSQDLGSFLIPFFPKQHGRSTNRTAATMAAVKIYYAAAFPSERMRGFSCPAFSHDKRISSMSIAGENKDFDITVSASKSYREKAQEVQLSPSSFNGGNSLQGEFHLEIAPYNAKKQTLLGEFRRIPKYIEVKSEDSVIVKSCQGVHPELN